MNYQFPQPWLQLYWQQNPSILTGGKRGAGALMGMTPGVTGVTSPAFANASKKGAPYSGLQPNAFAHPMAVFGRGRAQPSMRGGY